MIKNEDEDFELKQNYDNCELEELKRIRIMDKKFNEITKEIGIYLTFLFFLYYVSFINYPSSSITYNQLFQNTFVQPQNLNKIGLKEVIFLKSNKTLVFVIFNFFQKR